ncbi:MAG: DUF2281 domain-containing protein [Flavobacteriales bacterium]|nr:DUF2281 domain-containing protein [Flavobacteriales bacterium]
MDNIQLYTEISKLPAALKQEVKDFVDFLKSKGKSKIEVKQREFGCAKGMFNMPDNFDDALEDFKEYMQ